MSYGGGRVPGMTNAALGQRMLGLAYDRALRLREEAWQRYSEATDLLERDAALAEWQYRRGIVEDLRARRYR